MHDTIKLLQQIADNTATDNSVWVAAVAGGAAILGASISAVISYLVTSRSIKSQEKMEDKKLKANIITTERLRWLQDIRERLSKLYVLLDMQYNIIKRPIANQTQQQIQSMLDDYSSDVMLQINMITLMLNSKDQEQIDLRNELQNVLGYMQQCFSQTTSQAQTFNDQQYSQMKTNIFNLATSIGSEAWQQITELK